MKHIRDPSRPIKLFYVIEVFQVKAEGFLGSWAAPVEKLPKELHNEVKCRYESL